MEHANQESYKLELAIAPLTPEEEKEFDFFIEKIKLESSFDTTIKKREYEWQVVQQFGERAVPYILNLPKETHPEKINKLEFLNTLVTQKTAPLVLKAMQDGRVSIYEGALAAAKGKDKTALGLAELLVNLKLPNETARSDHFALLEALSVVGTDETVPYIIKFYENLMRNEQYTKMVKSWLKKIGVDLYKEDAKDVVIALARIGKGKARQVLEKLAKSGDGNIKPYAHEALLGRLYLGNPYEFKIKNPRKLLPKNDFYSQGFDPDLETSPADLYKEDKNFWPKKPEKLTQSAEVEFLGHSREMTENDSEVLKEYLHGRVDVWKTLGALSSKPEAESLKDFPKNKTGEALAAATVFELFKSLTHLPDYTALRNSLNELNIKNKAWVAELEMELGESLQFTKGVKTGDFYLKNFQHYVASFVQEDFRLPRSAEGFILWHEKLSKERNIKPFSELFSGKMEPILINRMFNAISGGTLSKYSPDATFDQIKHMLGLYRNIDTNDVPVYKQAAQRLKEVAKDRPQVFYGRDADYFYYAVKAEGFGVSGNKKPRKVYINRLLKDYLNSPDSEERQRILAYLLQEKVTEDALHIDTGFKGSVPEAVLRALNPKLSEEEINEKIKLLESRVVGRESMFGGGVVEHIEDRPHQYGDIRGIKRDEKTDRLKVDYYKADSWKELEAWVVSQAVIRYFAPRKK